MYLVLTWSFEPSAEGPRRGGFCGRDYQQSIADLPVQRWTHIEVFLRQSGNFDGQITVWQDGVQLFNEQGVRTRYPTGDQEWSVNNYGSGFSASPYSIYIDDAMIRVPN
jgi:hypothetical protein